MISLEKVALYLRKSRTDEDLEEREEEETLAKHKKSLLKLAKELDLNIVKIREEIVSGESLIHRPEMLALLKEVESKEYDAVLCMDVDRLGRGNMQEQGLILDTFKKSQTKIITPRKIYDLENEFDEEYSEFEAFMARKELKIINRRLQSGRVRSVEEGNYIGALPPYGYEIDYIDKYRTLKAHSKQAPIVQMIFDLYVNHNLGANKIATRLNELGYFTYTGKNWTSSSVLVIIKNKIYAGYVQWKKTENKKSKKIGQSKETKIRPREEWIEAKGKHSPIISLETYEKAQEILNQRYHVPYQLMNGLSNPLAGLIKCENCGASMILRSYKYNDDQIMCYAHCGNKSSKLKYVEKKLIIGLNKWLITYKANWDMYSVPMKKDNLNIKLYEKNISTLKGNLIQLENQKLKLHDFLEQGIYDLDTYFHRSKNLTERIDKTEQSIHQIQNSLTLCIQKEHIKKNSLPNIKNILDLYEKTQDMEKKNKLLKSILEHASYKKEKHQRNDEFMLTLYPKLPKQDFLG